MILTLDLLARMYAYEREVETGADLLLIALVVSTLVVLRSLARSSRMSLRRESLLTVLLAEIDRARNGGDNGGIAVAKAALDDELAAQARARFWHRVPRLGRPWPGQKLPPMLADLERRERAADLHRIHTNGPR